MDEKTKEGQVKQQVAGHPASEHFEQIDPHRGNDQHFPGESAAGGFPEGKSKPKKK